MNVINKIIDSELCVGCGACTYKSDVAMQWSANGFLEPASTEGLLVDGYKVCPFNITPDTEVQTENELGKIYLGLAPNHQSQMGYYYNTYVGYSEEFRLTSSSGGLATHLMTELLTKKIVQHVFSVGEGSQDDFYTYKVCSSIEDVLGTSKTRYYPVSMAEVLKKVDELDGRIAVVGTACFIKAIRLLQYYHPHLKEKIVFCIGIICGGQKSKYYADFLAASAGAPIGYCKPNFRIKDYKSSASDYSFGCKSIKSEEYEVKMRTLGDMWGTGLFKNNACDFCDDVTTELADISLGDAWLQPYTKDGRGTNVIVTRSKMADDLVKEGIEQNKLKVEELALTEFLKSQQGSFNHRHIGLKYRVKKAKQKNIPIPPKRFNTSKITLDFKLVQNQRLKVRKISLQNWVLANGELNRYNVTMKSSLTLLQKVTRLNHIIRRLKSL